MTQDSMIDHIADMAPDELRRNLRDAYGMTTALNREIEMLHGLRVKQAAQIAERDAEIEKWKQIAGMMEQISLHDERIRQRDARIAELEAAANKLERIRAMCNRTQTEDEA